MFISSGKTSLAARGKMETARAIADFKVTAVKNWPRLTHYDAIRNMTVLMDTLKGHRTSVNTTEVDIDTNIVFYTNITLALLSSMTANIILPNKGRNWHQFVAFNSILLAGDAVGIQRALGASYFAACYITTFDLSWFLRLQAEVGNYLEQVFYYSPSTKERYNATR